MSDFIVSACPGVVAEHEPLLACRPLLPSAEELLPYLRRVDRARWYANQGALVMEFERRLAAHLGTEPSGVVSAASGSAALVGAILGAAGRAKPERPLALCPAYTFVATVSAVEQCGYTPYLLDVEPGSWQLDASKLARHPQLARAGLIVPVAAYGRAIEQAPWQALCERTGIPVVIDGATSFEAMAGAGGRFTGRLPVALSFHATKAFATGEGGAAIANDAALSERIFRALNFGFQGSRESLTPSINGKMSEYHAAVGLAQFDVWDSKREAFAAAARGYRLAFADVGLSARFHGAGDVASNYALFEFAHESGCRAAQRLLAKDRIESRLWYGRGVHHQPYFVGVARDALPCTDHLAPSLLGLPMAPDLQQQDVQRVVSLVAQAVASA